MNKFDLDTPSLLIDLDRAEANIAEMQAAVSRHGARLRPHAKTHKSPFIGHLQVEAGAAGLTVAKVGEAEVMAAAGLRDLLVAFPLQGEGKLRRLCRLARWARISTTTDSLEVARDLSRVAVQEGVTVGLLIEVDTGLRRVGLSPGEPVLELARRVIELPGVDLVGLLTHAGHSHEVADPSLVAEVARREGELMVQTADLLRGAGLPVREVSVGSTPTARLVAAVPGVTEVRPGTYVYNDAVQRALGVATVESCALTVLATVVARPAIDRAIVDAGSKALTSDRPASGLIPGHGYVKGYGYERVVVERLYEEHGVLALKEGADLRIGQKVEIIPNHACPVVNLFDEFAAVRGERVEGFFPVAARGRMQ